MGGSRDCCQRSLRKWVRTCVCSGVLLSIWTAAGAAPDSRQILETDATRTVVEVHATRFAVGEVLDRFSLAVGGSGRSSMRVLRLDSHPVQLPADFDPQISEPRLGVVHKVRHSYLRTVEIPRYVRGAKGEWRELDSIRLVVDHPDLASVADRLDPVEREWEEKVLAPLLTNGKPYARQLRPLREQGRRLRRAPIEDTFSRSPRWVRLEVDRGGVYRVDYADLRTALGAEVDLIDPTTLRLFAARTPSVSPKVEDPAASWREDYSLRERAIRVEAGASTLGPGDGFWFFTAGPDDWVDRFDPSAGIWDRYDRTSSERIALWLTFEEVGQIEASTFGSPPLRMAEVDATPTGTARSVGHARSRLHFEENAVMAFGRVQDDWVWRDRIEAGGIFRDFVDLAHAHPGSLGWFSIEPAMDPPRLNPRTTEPDYREIMNWNSSYQTVFIWDIGEQTRRASAPVHFELYDLPVKDGLNELLLTNDSQPNDRASAAEMIVDSYSVAYRRDLEVDAPGLHWFLPAAEAASSARWEFQLTDSEGGLGGAVVLDTTDPWQPRWLQGTVTDGGAQLKVETAVAPTGGRFVATFAASAPRPLAIRRHRPRLLREEVSARANGGERLGYDMVILHPAIFRDSAEQLGAFRRSDLEGVSGARVATVDLQDVYDQFGAGTKDQAAIRNYLKFLFEVDPRLRFVVMVGDANRDARGVIENSVPDLCPAWVQTQWPGSLRNISLVPYARDDRYVSFDDPPVIGGGVAIDTPDVAIGRIPAGTLAEARQMVQRIIDYERNPASGTWRNTILLSADDEVGLAFSNYRETDHILQAEAVRTHFIPPALDIDQLYLTEFPTVSVTSRGKPTARQQMRLRWSKGRLIVHYIGHGSPEQMADENLFRIEDVASLTNGPKRPLFVAFSCDVSIFDDPIKRSMSEQLVLSNEGGAIATIAATQLTFIGPNNIMTNAFYQNLFRSRILDRSEPIGTAVWGGKVDTDSGSGTFVQHNSAKYVLLGDPALRLQSPTERLSLSGPLSQRIDSGRLMSVDVAFAGGAASTSGNWYLMAEESSEFVRYVMDDGPDSVPPGILPYELVGIPFFHGVGQYSGGVLQTQLRTPAFIRLGEQGRVRVIFEDGPDQFVGVADSLTVERGVADTDDSQGPTIHLEFANGARQVTPGMEVLATIDDPSGINVLGTVPANSILLEVDNSGVQTDATDLFRLDDNDYRRGSLSLALPASIEVGPHVLSLSAGDMMSNVSTAEIGFEVVAAGRMDISAHTPFPNPFSTSTQFAIEIIAPAGVSSGIELTVFTVDGQRVRTLRDRMGAGGGRLAIPWDGRDERGGEIANGTYLYTLRVDFDGPRAVTQTVTGRVVHMR